jgi:hypothetical protein
MRYYPCQPLSGPGQVLGDCPESDGRERPKRDDPPGVVKELTAPPVRYLIFPAVRSSPRVRLA